MSFKPFDRVVSFNPGSADQAWVEAELARFAKDSLAEAQREGAASPRYDRAVNGRLGAPEESVRVPGSIVYSFHWLEEAVVYALAFLQAAAPVRSGRYRRSFIVIADGREVPATDPALGRARMVQIVNTQPYSRKIEVGAKGFTAHRGLFEQKAKRAVNRRFPALVRAHVRFVELSDAYVLRRGSGNRRRGDRRAGVRLTYPALELVSETAVVN